MPPGGTPVSVSGLKIAPPKRAEAPPADDGLPALARLATDSGGRFTERSNDVGLGLARAQRDASCVYTLGFHEDDPRKDVMKSLQLRVKQSDLRVFHPSVLTARSEQAQRESLLRAAYVSPALFDSGALRLQFLPLRPASASAWEGALAISIPKPALVGAQSMNALTLGATLQMGTRIVHQFARKLTASGRQVDASDAAPFTLLEPMTLNVARYAATVVLSDPAKVRPESTRIAVELPEIPRGKPFLVGPGLVSGAADSAASDLKPVTERRFNGPRSLLTRTAVCVVKAAGKESTASVTRTLRAAAGAVYKTFSPVTLDLRDAGPVQCRYVVDELPAELFAAGGEFVFEATLEGARQRERNPGTISFVVDAPAAAAGNTSAVPEPGE